MTDPELVEQQRDIVQTFRQITAQRGQAEAEENARFEAERAAADAELARARAEAKTRQDAAAAALRVRRQSEETAANAASTQLRDAAAMNMATVAMAHRKAKGALERISAMSMLSEVSVQPLRASTAGDARAELARSVMAADQAANALPDLVDALLRARQRSERLRGVLAIVLIILALAVVALFLTWRARQEDQAATAKAVAGQATATAVAIGASATATAMAPLLADLQARSDMEMVYVPPGAFLMGSPDGQGVGDEHPRHTVYLSAYWIDKTEVTAAQYHRCVEAGDCTVPDTDEVCTYGVPARANHPVNCLDWSQATAYCAWADKRLPTEAEWEKAARGTDGRTYPWSDNGVIGNLLNFADVNLSVEWADESINDGYENTAPVATYPEGASPYGALDMAGNVWEWVTDWFDSGYYAQSPGVNPQGPTSGEFRVLRGGSWGDGIDQVRATFRFGTVPDNHYRYAGFRCALSP